MSDEQTYIPWDDATEAQRVAVLEMWWAKVCPVRGSDEYVFLQSMSLPSMGHGDPDAATKELFERGLLEPGDVEHRPNLTALGRALIFRIEEQVYGEYAKAAEEPTPEGIKRHPPDGYFHTDAFSAPMSEPCTCTPDCPEWCEGDCGCDACATRREVYGEEGSAEGEQ
ncbi:MAG: hypothetical protein V4567_09630 [Pseudomonadota bacterium]